MSAPAQAASVAGAAALFPRSMAAALVCEWWGLYGAEIMLRHRTGPALDELTAALTRAVTHALQAGMEIAGNGAAGVYLQEGPDGGISDGTIID